MPKEWSTVSDSPAPSIFAQATQQAVFHARQATTGL